MTTWFTSDPHWGHRLLADLRGFDTTDEMDAQLLENYNQQVMPQDTLYILGDLAMSVQAAAPVSQIACRDIRLIYGNHESFFYGKRPSHVKRYMDYGLSMIAKEQYLNIRGHTVLLSHFPYDADERHGDRYSANLPVDKGYWLLHGHTHTDVQVDKKQIHVGLDAWGLGPVSEDRIEEIIHAGS